MGGRERGARESGIKKRHKGMRYKGIRHQGVGDQRVRHKGVCAPPANVRAEAPVNFHLTTFRIFELVQSE